MNAQISKQEIISNVDFKELSKSCKTQDDLAKLTQLSHLILSKKTKS